MQIYLGKKKQTFFPKIFLTAADANSIITTKSYRSPLPLAFVRELEGEWESGLYFFKWLFSFFHYYHYVGRNFSLEGCKFKLYFLFSERRGELNYKLCQKRCSMHFNVDIMYPKYALLFLPNQLISFTRRKNISFFFYRDKCSRFVKKNYSWFEICLALSRCEFFKVGNRELWGNEVGFWFDKK